MKASNGLANSQRAWLNGYRFDYLARRAEVAFRAQAGVGTPAIGMDQAAFSGCNNCPARIEWTKALEARDNAGQSGFHGMLTNRHGQRFSAPSLGRSAQILQFRARQMNDPGFGIVAYRWILGPMVVVSQPKPSPPVSKGSSEPCSGGDRC
jgi:hypothetical protein